MTTVNRYFTLTTSDDSLTKRFRVLVGSWNNPKERAQTVRRTIDGQLDISQGSIFQKHDYVVRLREEEEDTDYGTLSDLNTFWMYNNPNGTASDKMTFIDHFGNESIVVFSGDFNPQPMGAMVVGKDGWYAVHVVLLEVEDLGVS